MDAFDFGLRIRELRESRNMSQETLGKKNGRSKPVVSSYENNIKTPPLDVLIKISNVFNVSLDYLAGNDDHAEIFDSCGLTPEQSALIKLIIEEFQQRNKAVKGLSNQQLYIINLLLIEFMK